jgi:signal transduction histidine kinase
LSTPRVLSSTARLALWYIFAVAIGASALLWSSYLLTQRAMERQVDLVIQTEIESLREEYRGGGIKRLVSVLDQRTDDWGRLGAAYLLVDRQGAPLGGNLAEWPRSFSGNDASMEFEIIVNEQGRAVSHPVRAAVVTLNGNRLLVGTDVSDRRRFERRLRRASFWGIGLTVALMALTGWWFSRRVAARVRAVAQACDSIISGDLTRRLPLEGNADEFDQLAGTVNGMLDRIEQQTTAVRVTFNSAAHDLRAPMHRIRARLESALHAASLDSAAAAAMEATVEDLERVQRTLATPAERVDLARLARELGELYAPEAQQRQLQLRVVAEAPACISGHQQLLAQMVTNLLENGLKYLSPGGCIELRVGTGAGQVQLTVSDNGRGIPAARHAEMLLPFRRHERDAGAPGSGLGLSLVAAVVRLHHGRLEMFDAAPGLAVRCSFAALDATSGGINR